jgi:hypothetical protein
VKSQGTRLESIMLCLYHGLERNEGVGVYLARDFNESWRNRDMELLEERPNR